jgi:hypothetical protein
MPRCTSPPNACATASAWPRVDPQERVRNGLGLAEG